MLGWMWVLWSSLATAGPVVKQGCVGPRGATCKQCGVSTVSFLIGTRYALVCTEHCVPAVFYFYPPPDGMVGMCQHVSSVGLNCGAKGER